MIDNVFEIKTIIVAKLSQIVRSNVHEIQQKNVENKEQKMILFLSFTINTFNIRAEQNMLIIAKMIDNIENDKMIAHISI